MVISAKESQASHKAAYASAEMKRAAAAASHAAVWASCQDVVLGPGVPVWCKLEMRMRLDIIV